MPFPPSPPHETLARFDRFAEILIEAARETNLTAITDPEGIRTKHFEDSLAALPLLEKIREKKGGGEITLLDIGSGAGFPGLALALAAPWLSVTSLEATGKKVRFQQSVIDALGLTNASVQQGRAEIRGHEPAHRESYDVVTARAFAELAVLAELALPLARPGGVVLAWKGPRLEEELPPARKIIAALGGGKIQSTPYTLSSGATPDATSLRIVTIPKTAPTPLQYPRQMNQILKSRTRKP